MLKSITKWGLVVGAVMTVVMYVPQLLLFDNIADSYALAEMVGYIGMIASLLIIVLAINAHFKDAGPDVSLWSRILLGLGITFIAGVIFGLTNIVYTFWINPEFMDQYYNQMVADITAQGGDDVDAKIAELESQRAMFVTPQMIFLVMAATVWMIGIVVSVLAGIGHWFMSRRGGAPASV